MFRLIDITFPICPRMQVWPGDPEIRFHPGAVVRVELGAHTGTHVDAPRHYVEDGATVDQLDLADLCGPCRVLDVAGMDRVQLREAFEECRRDGVGRVLLKAEGGATLDLEGAHAAKRAGLRLVGPESMSIEEASGDGSVHRTLLEAGILILERLRLDFAAPGDYMLWALPIPLAGLDGAPCRVVLQCIR